MSAGECASNPLIPRDAHGRFLPGAVPNPKGRPKGARDKRRRYRASKPQPWSAANLGHYAEGGGPGRKKGGKNRAHDDVAAAFALIAETEALLRLTEGKPTDCHMILRMVRLLVRMEDMREHFPPAPPEVFSHSPPQNATHTGPATHPYGM